MLSLFGLIPWIARVLLRRKPSLTDQHATRIASVIGWSAILLLAVAAFLTWDWLDDRAAIREHEQKRVEQALESERRANTNGFARAEARERESAETIEELETIHAEDPEAAAAPASRGSRAVADRLRP